MGLTRLELVTPRLSSVCSNQLSYWPQTPPPDPPTEGPTSRDPREGTAPGPTGQEPPSQPPFQPSPKTLTRPNPRKVRIRGQRPNQLAPVPGIAASSSLGAGIVQFQRRFVAVHRDRDRPPRSTPSEVEPGRPVPGMNKHYVRTPANHDQAKARPTLTSIP